MAKTTAVRPAAQLKNPLEQAELAHINCAPAYGTDREQITNWAWPL